MNRKTSRKKFDEALEALFHACHHLRERDTEDVGCPLLLATTYSLIMDRYRLE